MFQLESCSALLRGWPKRDRHASDREDNDEGLGEEGKGRGREEGKGRGKEEVSTASVLTTPAPGVATRPVAGLAVPLSCPGAIPFL